MQDNVPPPTLEEAETMLRHYSHQDLKLSDPKWLAHFQINSRLASAYRQDRIFLVGDAAHIHSPVGGQGMNTGIQDAFNLAWKLSLRFNLDSYHHERHQVAKTLLKFTERASSLVTLHNPAAIFIRNHLISWLTPFTWVQKLMTTAVSQIAICYRKSSCIDEKGHFLRGPKLGTRAPNASVMYQQQQNRSFHTLEKPTFTFSLIVMRAAHGSRELIPLAKKFSQHAKVILITRTPAPEIEGATIVHDDDDQVHKRYGVHKCAAYVIRPDIYIGYKQTPIDEVALENYFKKLYI